MKTEKHQNWLSAYLVGEQRGMAVVCGVALDFAAITVWGLLFFSVVDTFSRFVSDWLVYPVLAAVVAWTWLRVTRAWHYSQQEKLAKQKEQEEIERVFLEQNRKN